MEKLFYAILEEAFFILILDSTFWFWAFHRHTLVLISVFMNLIDFFLVQRQPLTLNTHAASLLPAWNRRF
jgi:hypothetical protein